MSEEQDETEAEKEKEAEELLEGEKDLRSDLEIIQDELNDVQNKYLRVLADSENSRKRMQKERQDLTKYAIENALVEFLHPLDCLEKALGFAETMSDEVRNWAIGFEMILSQFKQVLSNHGVEEYHSVGKPFDPHLHEAIESIETDEYEPGIIVDEDVRGYKMGDRPIRVARVKVAKEKEQQEKGE